MWLSEVPVTRPENRADRAASILKSKEYLHIMDINRRNFPMLIHLKFNAQEILHHKWVLS